MQSEEVHSVRQHRARIAGEPKSICLFICLFRFGFRWIFLYTGAVRLISCDMSGALNRQL